MAVTASDQDEPTRKGRLSITSADNPSDGPPGPSNLEEPSAPRRSRSWTRSRSTRGAVTVAVWLGAAVLAGLAIHKVGFVHVSDALTRANLVEAVAAVAIMCAAMGFRAVSWHASLRAALPDEHIRFLDATRGLLIGVLVSSTVPANLGEAFRAVVVARKTTRPRSTLPVIAGTQMSQAFINVAAVIILGAITLATTNLLGHFQTVVILGLAASLLLLAALLGSPFLLRRAREGSSLARLQRLLYQVRTGLAVFRHLRLGALTVAGLAAAWAVQWSSIYVLLISLHLDGRAGPAAVTAILFAVNLTLLLPLTPGNVGVFQAVTAFVLNAGWNVPYDRGVAFGIALQAAELIAALIAGVPALLREGMSWRAIARRRPLDLDLTETAPNPTP